LNILAFLIDRVAHFATATGEAADSQLVLGGTIAGRTFAVASSRERSKASGSNRDVCGCRVEVLASVADLTSES
jgi:hypothetical protein